MLRELALAESSAHDELVAHKAVEAVKVTMARAEESEEALVCRVGARGSRLTCQEWALSALWNLSYLPQNEAIIRNLGCTHDVLATLQRFPTSPVILVSFLFSLQSSCSGTCVWVLCSISQQ